MINKLKSIYKKLFLSPEKVAKLSGVTIGVNCDIQDVNFGSEPYLISIGDHVQITSGTKIFTHGAAWVFREEKPEIDFFGKVTIGCNVYIGNNCLIMPGVTIGENVVVAAGSVVTKSIPNNVIVGGNPAKIIGQVNELMSKMSEYNVGTKGMSYDEKRNFLLSLQDSRFIKK